MATSFQNKRKVKSFGINGTKVSLPNKLLLTSTGVPSFDSLLGGGIAVGSIILIEEDIGHVYSDFILKCFLSEGVLSDHEIFVSSLEVSADEIINNLPGVSSASSIQKSSTAGSDNLKIAWRYKDMSLQAENTSQFGHCFDMSKKLEEGKIRNSKKACFDDSSLQNDVTSSNFTASTPYQEMIKRLNFYIQENNLSTKSDKKHETILRLGIHSLGSPQWNSLNTPESLIFINRFLLCLKNVIRRSYSVAFVTVPSHLFQDVSIIDEMGKHCDAIFRLESFAATPLENKEMWKDYNGLFHVVKLPKLNSSVLPEVDTSDLAFKIKRRRFTIEKVHLPPLYADDNNEKTNNVTENSKKLYQTASCSKPSLDF